MHIFFSGIGGAGIGPLALVALQAGYEVSGSDAHNSSYIGYLRQKGIANIHIGQTEEQIAKVHEQKPIDWFVYSSALPKTDPNHPELKFCAEHNIKISKRGEFLNKILEDKNLKLVAIAGTHGKTTTTTMVIWLFKQLGMPVSYSVGAKISFGDMGAYEQSSKYFVYETDEYDKNFLSFYPSFSLITGIDWDHPDIYPTRESYYAAFNEFLGQSEEAILWHDDTEKLGLNPNHLQTILDEKDPKINQELELSGFVNRLNGWQAVHALHALTNTPLPELLPLINNFPGLSRRFEQIVPHLYSDYAHTPPKIRGALQMAQEVSDNQVVVVYEGLHNTRQHFIKDELAHLFDNVGKLYIVPSYLAREDESLKLLSPADIKNLLSPESQARAVAIDKLDDKFKELLTRHIEESHLVLALSAGGADSLDEWLRKEFSF